MTENKIFLNSNIFFLFQSKRYPASTSQVNVSPPKTADDRINEDFHLPPLERIDSVDSQKKQYSPNSDHHSIKKFERQYFSRLTSDVGSKISIREKLSDINDENEVEHFENSFINKKDSRSSSSLDFVSEKLSLKMSTPPNTNSSDKVSLSCSSFLPYIEPVPEMSVQKKSFRSLNTPNAQYAGLNYSSSYLNPIIKYDVSKIKYAHRQCPLTSSQALSSKRLVDLDHWIQNRPKTTPEGTIAKTLFEEEPLCKNKLLRENRMKQKFKRSIKNPLSVSLGSGEKSSLMMEAFANHRDIPYDIASSLTSKDKPDFLHSHSKTDVETFLTAGLRG